jgi:hypothetical protein
VSRWLSLVRGSFTQANRIALSSASLSCSEHISTTGLSNQILSGRLFSQQQI